MTIIDATDADFATEVIERSHTTPVVVDFWAPWCAPCRQLTPVLEETAAAHEGAVVLAKVNTEDHPDLGQAHGVQSIPAVKAFVDGKVVDEFVGGQPPAFVKRFFAKLVPSEADGLVSAGDEGEVRRALELEPGHADASLKLAALLHERGEVAEALTILEKVRGSYRADGMAASIRLADDPDLDLEAAFAALGEGQVGEGLQTLLDRVRRFPAQREDLRAMIVGILDELGPEHPVARPVRRELAAALY